MEIVLIRHGRPVAATNPRVNANEFVSWIDDYRVSLVAEDSQPIAHSNDFPEHYLISSDLKRAIHSCRIQTGKEPSVTDPIFREMDIPHYNLPFRLRAWTWVYLCRLFWFCGVKGDFESFKQGQARAEEAADKLVTVAKEHGKVLMFGHGVSIFFIRKALVKRGWLVECKSQQYWGVSKLSKG